MAGEGWKRFTRLFRRRIDTLVGIDFGHGAVKVAEVSLKGDKPYLKTYAIAGAPTDLAKTEREPAVEDGQSLTLDENALTEQLSRAISLSGVRTKDAVLAVGGQAIFMREVAFPNLASAELAEAIKWDIPKYVPYEADSYEFDYAVTGHDPQTGELRVLVVAAPKMVVKQLIQVVRKAGLTPVAVDIEPLAVFRTMTGMPGANNSLLMDVGVASTQMSLFQHGNPVLTRVVPVGEARFTQAMARASAGEATGAAELEEMLEELGQEVRRTSQFFNLQDKRATIEKVIMTGAVDLDNLVRQLKPKIELPLTGHNPLAGLTISPSISTSHAQKVGPQLAVAIGLAMRGDEA